MPKKPKYTRQYNDRHGKRRTEFRRAGFGTWPLREPIGFTEFWEDYNAALNGKVPPGVLASKPNAISKATPQSFRWLFEEYKKSANFTNLQSSTRQRRSNLLEEVCLKHGDKPYTQMHRQAVLKLRDNKSEKIEAANGLLKALRQLFEFAIDYEHIEAKDNPTFGVKYLKSGSQGFHAWTTDEVSQFENHFAVGTKARLALAVMLYGGCARVSDLRRIGKQHITREGRLKYVQFKNRNVSPVEIDIRIIDEFKEILDASPTGDLTFVVTDAGNQFSERGIGNWFKKKCVEAGLPHCSAHGVRKAAAARLAELRCSDHEIMAIGGWKTLREVQRYTKGARKRVMADSAMDKVQADIDRTKVSNLEGDVKKVRQK